ncbi:hypothetical protein AVEN_230005-1 [Araneus ventricosus]|uniref:Uncharacterized protein n=1 Tax=Araneus ventricosus TaxID=182803 RepID=A0A4Y2CUM7_ARAVE|nr:hypothetical protein AVEN_230005-1 [Araneus ventricosus]
MDLDFVPASIGGMGLDFAHKTLESQFRPNSFVTANDVFFIIEVLWVQIVISVNEELKYTIPRIVNHTINGVESFDVTRIAGRYRSDDGESGHSCRVIFEKNTIHPLTRVVDLPEFLLYLE